MGLKKFHEFVYLRKTAKAAAGFQERYRALPRNSGKCHALWLQVVRFEGIALYLRNEVGRLFVFNEEGMLPEDFVARRTREEKQLLAPIEKAITQACSHVNKFISHRAKYSKEFGENGTVVNKDKNLNKKYNNIYNTLRDAVQAWFDFVKEEVELNTGEEYSEKGEKGDLVQIVTDYTAKQVNEEPIFDFTISLISELKERLKYADKGKNGVEWKRVKDILPAIKDIFEYRKDAALRVMIEAAEQRAPKRRGSRNSKVKQRRSSSQASLPGIQTIGPFEVLPLDQEWMDKFDFDRTYNTLIYTGDLSQDIVNRKGYNVKGRTSPTAPISITDEQTRRSANIPLEAKHYSYVYPIPYTKLKYRRPYTEEERDNLEAVDNLLFSGGYVYYSEDMRMLQINALKPGGSDLYFVGPFSINEELKEKVNEIASSGRFQNCTVAEHRSAGATEYAWLRPGELGNQNHGCLMFRYGSDHATYFEVVNRELGQGLMLRNNKEKLNAILRAYDPQKE